MDGMAWMDISLTPPTTRAPLAVLITEVFGDEKTSRGLHQGHRSLSFMSKSEQQEPPSADGPSHFARLGSSVTRDQGRAGSTTMVRVSRGNWAPRSPASSCFFPPGNRSAITLLRSCWNSTITSLYWRLDTIIQWFWFTVTLYPTRLGRGQIQHLLAGQCRGEDNIWLANSPKIASTV